MRVGIPREIKTAEHRVALLPQHLHVLQSLAGVEFWVESGAGLGASCTDEDYAVQGARVGSAAQIWDCDLVLKVKEPQAAEYPYFRPDLTLFAYLHLAADRELTLALMHSGIRSYAFETYRDVQGRLPLLAPMSAVAGRMAVFYGARALQKAHGGPGLLLGQILDLPAPKVAVIGAGVAGTESVRAALGLGAQVLALDLSPGALQGLQSQMPQVQTAVWDPGAWELLRDADLIVGAVLLPGASAPRLLNLEQIQRLKKGAVLVDISIDQGGCFEGARPTTHLSPFLEIAGHTLCAVANLPGAVPQTSSLALGNALLEPLKHLIAGSADPGLDAALSTVEGALYCSGTARAHGLPLGPV